MFKNRYTIIFVLIILLAIILRVYALDRVPPSLFGDEIDVGYHAYSLLHTGRDYMGQLLPTYIHSFSEWRAPLLMYATVPFVALFGLNEWAVRLTPVFFGVLSIVLSYFVTLRLTNKKSTAVLTAGLLAITPWHLQYSRTAFEVTLLMSLVFTGLICFLKALRSERWLVGSAVAFALMFYTYSTAVVYVPLLVIGLCMLYRQELRPFVSSQKIIALIVGTILLVPFGWQTVTGVSSERFSLLSIFSDPKAVATVEAERNFDYSVGQSSLITKLDHNKPLVVTKTFVHNYLEAFSPQFLFISGDPNPRQSVGGMGELYSFMAILILLGIYNLIKNQSSARGLLLVLTIIAPMPAALTRDGGMHATRLFLLLIPLMITAGIGADTLIDQARTRLLPRLALAFLILAGLVSMLFYSHRYYIHMPVESYKVWQYGYKDGLTYIKNHEREFDKILITNSGNPTLGRALFYTAYDPVVFQAQFLGDKPQPDILPGFDGFAVGKFYFVTMQDNAMRLKLGDFLQPKTAFLISQDKEVGGDWDWRKDPPAGIEVLQTTQDPLGQPMFYVVTRKQ